MGFRPKREGWKSFTIRAYGNGAPRIYEVAKEDEGQWMGILETSFLRDSFFGEDFPFTGVLFFRADPNAIVSAIEQARDIPYTLYPNPASWAIESVLTGCRAYAISRPSTSAGGRLPFSGQLMPMAQSCISAMRFRPVCTYCRWRQRREFNMRKFRYSRRNLFDVEIIQALPQPSRVPKHRN